jgi:CRISPR system Cascade subunit CasA
MNELQSAEWGFDLLVEPWITCVSADGGVREYGIEDLLSDAHNLSEIIDPSPLVVVSAIRLLEAVLLSSLGIDDEDGWLTLWQGGRFDEKAMSSVRRLCAERMDLFDCARPFYQSCDIDPGGTSEHAKSVGYLFPEAATGTAVIHYVHAAEDEHAYCPVCCAKGLVMLPAFATSGGQGIKPSINGVPPLYVLPVGRSVFETLLLNCVISAYRPPMALPLDPGPFWASDGVVGHKEERVSVGFVESLTWQPRRVRLLSPFSEGVCTRCGRTTAQLARQIVFDQGVSRPRDAASWLDPWAAYVWRTDKMGATTVRPLRPQADRQTWRDVGALFLTQVPEAEASARGRATRPAIVNQTAYLAQATKQDGLAEIAGNRYMTVGIRTNMKAKVFEWSVNRFDMPNVVLGPRAALPVTRALRHAETAADAVGNAVMRLHPGTERENPSWSDVRTAMGDVIRPTQREYWSEIEPEFRSRLFDERLAGDEEDQAAWLSEWTEVVRAAIVGVLERVLAASDDTADGLRRQEAARHVLFTQLKKGGVT